jgi:hypothetical protein
MIALLYSYTDFDSSINLETNLWTFVGIRVLFSFPVSFEIRSGLGVIKSTMNLSTYQIGPVMH